MEVSPDGTTRNAGFAPHLDYRPIREEEKRVLRDVGDLPKDAVERAKSYATGVLAQEHLKELRERREAQIEKVRFLVRERLTAEIGYWDRRLGELWDEVARKPDVRVTINDFTRRRDTLSRRLERRMEELERELDIIPAPPNIIGAALIIPAGMEANYDSDIDLLVVFEHVEWEEKRELAIQVRLAMLDVSAPIDIMVTDLDEIERRGDMVGSILRPALREGEVLYERKH